MHIRAAKIIYALDWYGQTRGPGFNEMEHHSGNVWSKTSVLSV